jgi:hypothetical protein
MSLIDIVLWNLGVYHLGEGAENVRSGFLPVIGLITRKKVKLGVTNIYTSE